MDNLPDNWPQLSLGRRLARRRRGLGYTLTRMAGVTGISAERLQRLESDGGRLAPVEIAPLMAGYDLTTNAWLVGQCTVLDRISPQFRAGLSLLTADEVAAVGRLVRNLTAGRVSARA
ncbi:helix-turn-helix domain-containing protein (plasmid) [Microbulbifer sp. DLAB2-AF]|uniref:helix-turn-helix domain-containing protein n=1 Tax=unclassified Microbulbifer TaxID=2619833 RepID=UPI0040390573